MTRRQPKPAVTYPPGFFYAVVREWKGFIHEPQSTTDFRAAEISRRASDAREEAMQSDDAWTRTAARGHLGSMTAPIDSRPHDPLPKRRRRAE